MSHHIDAVVEAAHDGIEHEQFAVAAEGETYELVTPEATYDSLTESAFREALESHADEFALDWYFWSEVVGERTPHRRAFLQWLEGVGEQPLAARYEALDDGISHEWGQLRISVEHAGHGERVYDVRHVADADADHAADELDAYHDPLAARQLATYDEKGRYRPLKSGANLAGGWVFPDLDARDVVETVETFYPASVPNWYREREGELDVVHWEDAIGRQTGMYGVVQTWNRGEGHEHVEWVAEATCDDSQCVKRREWQYDDETDLDADGGDGAFPCREPCSVVIAASRKWTRLEAEETRTYEFDLTPSEKEQVEAIIDAVAEGRIDEIREADIYEGANRYRTRFFRAKRFDEDGNLCGVPTDDE
ncbi:DR2241 family protein [Haloferax namakaokahaiae]|uniref:DR2241 family protein n=1 Tax=Haloferax namakaokahaiae TaxID=1748331 RepID=A0ABD5ZF30_9EURY